MAKSYMDWAQPQQQPNYADALGGFGSVMNYAPVPAAPELFSAKPGFDWGGASATPPVDWSKSWQGQGTGGFTGAGLEPQGMFGGVFDNFLGKKNKDGSESAGWGGTALGVANGLFNGYMGMKQFGLSKDIFDENKKQFSMNWDANKTLTNGRLEDRQKARLASNAGAYESLGSYMKKNGVA